MNARTHAPYSRGLFRLVVLMFCFGAISFPAMAQLGSELSTSNQQQAIEISKELRCPMAVNQSLFESQAPIAHELKGQIFLLLEQGYKRNEILDFMVQRYGEKIRYQPEFKAATFALWFGPLGLLILGLGLCFVLISPQKKSTN